MQETKLLIVVGHYGSGKTEFCVNLVNQLRDQDLNVAIADLDIVNPYFRSRECREAFARRNIKLVSNLMDNDPVLDSPAMSPEIQSFFLDNHRFNILDVGGDAVGARVLSQYREQIWKRDYDMLLVVNANRYQTQTAPEVISYLNSIDAASGLRINGFINNTHMLKDTTAEDVIRGDRLCHELSKETGLPVRYTCCLETLAEEVKNLGTAGACFPIKMNMREAWMT